MNVLRFYRFDAAGRLEIAKVRITQKSLRAYRFSKQQRPPYRAEAIAGMRAKGFFRSSREAKGFRRRGLVEAVRKAFA